jgi:peptide chain release factor 1
MFERLEKIKIRYEEVTRLLSDPVVINSQDKFRELSKEHSELTPIVNAYNQYLKTKNEINNLHDIINADDVELQHIAES